MVAVISHRAQIKIGYDVSLVHSSANKRNVLEV